MDTSSRMRRPVTHYQIRTRSFGARYRSLSGVTSKASYQGSKFRTIPLALTDPHSPGQFRANGIVRNFDPWYEAFDVTPDNDLYLAPNERVRIW